MLEPAKVGLRTRLFQIIFESDTTAGKAFDIALAALILLSVAVVMLDSVAHYHERFGALFYRLEWMVTVLFSIELAVRIYCLKAPIRYLRSFYGVIDVLSILPMWLALLIPDAHMLVVFRLLRTLRLIRVLDMASLAGQGRLLLEALHRSRGQILLFLFSVFLVVTIFSTLLYMIEPPEAGFTSIPKSIYWGIVTLTTVGYGDITPITPLGQFISVVIMLTGYSIIALPIGVFSAEVINTLRAERYSNESCPGCGSSRHESDARYCKYCGTWLNEETRDPRRSQ